MNILIDKIRIRNFRALKDIEVTLKPITLLVGANNAGKTTFLKALNSVLGFTKNQINKDDLFAGVNSEQSVANEIVIDIKIIPVDDKGERVQNFGDWTGRLGGAQSLMTENDFEAFAFRTIYTFGIEDSPIVTNKLFTNWDTIQLQEDEFKGMSQIRNSIKMYFIDAQRDILDDSRQRTSFFGKLVSQLDYGSNLTEIQSQIDALNVSAIDNSEVLTHLQSELSKLNKTTNNPGEGVSISPFSKNIRDLHKGMKVYFQDNGSESFSMDYHGMGTRSWASIITAGAFTSWELQQIEDKIANGIDADLLFPLFALEEPEAHLHPNAQRTLYKQLKAFKGQKIISTHSPYIAGQAELDELRHFYKEGNKCVVSEILFDQKEREKIEELEGKLKIEGKTKEAYKKYNPEITELKKLANSKLTTNDKRKLHKEILLSKGELLFARALVLFEGVTEELALPVFYEKHFNRNHFEDGVTFVSVSGKLNYSPFLKVSKYLKIPVFILSDGDENTEDGVSNQIKDAFGNIGAIPCYVLPESSDFEKYLVLCDYKDEILKAIDIVKGKNSYLDYYIEQLNGEKGNKGIIRDYNGDAGIERALLDCMSADKADFAEQIAEQIVLSDKAIPPKIRELFDKISETLHLNPSHND